ncbi:unnamed protein product [Paramecium pentaurelia]|uniref:VIT domain-containing protein n=1 Tax=Paramecium pentaurelia TaxID=43138 RepID=A0A8S1YNI4_9CILI|nr:unnamed protein product [Paramecium pentaurelia]
MNKNKLYEPKIGKKEQKLKQIKKEYIKYFVFYDLTKKSIDTFEIDKIFIQDAQLNIEQSNRTGIVFSINENATISKIVVQLGEVKFYGVIKEKDNAKQEYKNNAIQ